MATPSVSLDIVILVMDALVCDTAQYTFIGGSSLRRTSSHEANQTPKESGSPPWVTLKRCALACKSWRPLAQKRLFCRLTLYSPQRHYTCSRQPDLAELYKSIKTRLDLTNIQVLHITGRWFAQHSRSPSFLHLLYEHGRTRTFVWDMGCCAGCPHWPRFPEEFQRALDRFMKCRSLTAMMLRGLCVQFPLHILGQSPLQHLELSGDFREEDFVVDESLSNIYLPSSAVATPTSFLRPISLELDGPAAKKLLSYMQCPDIFRLKFDSLTSVTVNAFDTLELVRNVLDKCSTTVETIIWKYWPIFINREGIEEISYDLILLNIYLGDLLSVQTVDLHVNLSTLYLKSFHHSRRYEHLAVLPRILDECGLPKSMKTLNIWIEHCPNFVNEDLGIDPHENFRRDLMKFDVDGKLAQFCTEAKTNGRSKEVAITLVVRDFPSLQHRFGYPLTKASSSAQTPPTMTTEGSWVEETDDDRSMRAELSLRMADWFRETKKSGFLHWNVIHYRNALHEEQIVW